jgi:hypothetical protein
MTSAVDRDACARAIAIMREREPDEEWSDSVSAAARCQDLALRLRPWQPVPCASFIRDYIDEHLAAGDDGVMGRYAAARIAKRLLDLGLSVFEPDPLAAIKRAGRKVPAS